MTTLPQTAPMRITRPAPLALQGGGGPMGSPMSAAAQSPGSQITAADILRVIRGNIWLIISLVIAGGIGGYLINSYLAAHYSRYTATGYILCQSEGDMPMAGQVHNDALVFGLDVEKGTIAKQLTHPSLMSQVLTNSSKIRDTAWFKEFNLTKNGQPFFDADAAKADLLKRLGVEPYPNSRIIGVTFSYSVPKDCQTIVTEVVNQDLENARSAETTRMLDHNSQYETLRIQYEGELKEATNRLYRLANYLGEHGVDISTGSSIVNSELALLIGEQLKAASDVAAMQTKLNTFQRELDGGAIPPEVEDALEHNGAYSEYRRMVDEADEQIAELTLKLGPTNDMIQLIRKRRENYQAKLDQMRDEVMTNAEATTRARLVNEQEAAKASLDRISKLVEEKRALISEIGTKRNEYGLLLGEAADIRSKLSKVKDAQETIANLYGSGSKWASVTWNTYPELPTEPSFPKLAQSLPAGLGLGLALALGIAFLRELSDTTVRSPRDIARIGQLTVLGMIPHEADDPQSAGARLPLVIFEAPQSMVAEQFRQVRTRLQQAASLDTTRSILVTSCSPQDGKSTVACNLAAGLALNGRRILLVDANFRRPELHTIFNLPNEKGFADVLDSLDAFEEVVRETDVPNLAVLTSGVKPANPTELLESQLLIDFIERALEEFDHVVFDSGPLLIVSETAALAPRVDGVVTVVRARGNKRGLLQRMRDQLRQLKAEHLGVILNAVRSHGGGYYGPMIKSYYAYQNT